MAADTDLIRAYGSASSRHAENLAEVACRLRPLGATCTSTLGLVAASFSTAFTRASEGEARVVTELGASIAAAHAAAHSAAAVYQGADEDAGARLTGIW